MVSIIIVTLKIIWLNITELNILWNILYITANNERLMNVNLSDVSFLKLKARDNEVLKIYSKINGYVDVSLHGKN